MRALARFDRDVGERVGRRDAPPGGGAASPPDLAGLQQGPIGMLAAPLASSTSKLGLQPDRDAGRAIALARRGVHEGAAAGRQNLGPRGQEPRDHLALAVAEVGFSKAIENLGDASIARRPRSRRRRRRTGARGGRRAVWPTEVLPAPIIPTSAIGALPERRQKGRELDGPRLNMRLFHPC